MVIESTLSTFLCAGITSLRYLNLRGQIRVTLSGVARLAALTRLEFLNLSQMRGAVLPSLSALRTLPLQSLRVAGMSLGDNDRYVAIKDLLRWLIRHYFLVLA